MNADLFSTKPERVIEKTIQLTFDGGTPCNNPSLGYGIGYGSWHFEGLRAVQRINHRVPCSNNAAELLTLCVALEHLAIRVPPETTHVEVIGDSQIALKWLKVAAGDPNGGHRKKAKVSEGSSELFKETIQRLVKAAEPFAKITAIWQPREKSVELFGH